MARILLVDDDLQALSSTSRILELAGHQMTEAHDGEQALAIVREMRSGSLAPFDAVISDVRMPRLSGVEFLRAMSILGDTTPVILMTAFGQVDEAVWAMKFGAVDFLTKPFKRQGLLDALEAALRRKPSRTLVPDRVGTSTATPVDSRLLGTSLAIGSLRARLLQVAPTDATVLLRGPSGSGKELVASEIHRLSRRAQGPFIALNCAAIPDELIESELFGHEKGAFSGATDAKKGLFEAAHGGTIFLDEIGDMPLLLQATLLRSLQEREVRRLGATQSRKIDVRVISATHRDLTEAVKSGAFREDLLFRLEVVGLQVPALSERREDLSILAKEFLHQTASRHGKRVRELSSEVEDVFLQYSWPGNVRELINVIERAVIFAEGERVGLGDLPPHLIQFQLVNQSPPAFAPHSGTSFSVSIGTPLRDVEELLIRKTLEATFGDKSMTAKLLGINSRTIYRKLEKGQVKEPSEAANVPGNIESSPVEPSPSENNPTSTSC